MCLLSRHPLHPRGRPIVLCDRRPMTKNSLKNFARRKTGQDFAMQREPDELREEWRDPSADTPKTSVLFFLRLLSVLQEVLDQVLGSLIGLLLRLADSIHRVLHDTTPHQFIGFWVDNVGHDAALSVIGGPDIGPVTPAPAPAAWNAITPTKSPAVSKSTNAWTKARALN